MACSSCSCRFLFSFLTILYLFILYFLPLSLDFLLLAFSFNFLGGEGLSVIGMFYSFTVCWPLGGFNDGGWIICVHECLLVFFFRACAPAYIYLALYLRLNMCLCTCVQALARTYPNDYWCLL